MGNRRPVRQRRDSTVAQIGKPPIMPWEFASTRVVAALVPIPRPTFFYWNSNVILDHIPYPALSFALAAAAFAWILFVVSFDCFASVLFGTSVVLLVGLFSGVYSGSVRHHGFIYVAFVMSAWIALQAAHDRRGIDGSTRAFRERALGVTFVAVLILQCPGSVVAIAFDVRYIFSSGARAARSLQENGLADALIVAEVDYPATAMLGQLGPRAMAYSPRTGRPFSFVRWTRSRSWDPTDEDTLQFAAALGRSRGEDPVVVMNRPLLPELIDSAGVRRVAELYDSMIEEENFYIYRVSRTRAPRSPSVAH